MSRKSNADKENAIRILDYWFLMEFLNQQSISSFTEIEKKTNTYKKDLNSGNIKRPKKVVEDFIPFKTGDNLQTITKTATEEMQLSMWSDFTVFVGSIRKEITLLIRIILLFLLMRYRLKTG